MEMAFVKLLGRKIILSILFVLSWLEAACYYKILSLLDTT